MNIAENIVEQNTIAHLNPELVHVNGGFVPSKSLNYKTDKAGNITRTWDRIGVQNFERKLRADLKSAIAGVSLFPSQKEVHVALTFGMPPHKYTQGDLDNKAKTILDAMKGPIYPDDCQVKILYVNKIRTEPEEEWFLIAVKLLL